MNVIPAVQRVATDEAEQAGLHVDVVRDRRPGPELPRGGVALQTVALAALCVGLAAA